MDLASVPGSGCDGRLFAPQVEALRGTARTHVVENTAQPRIDRLARAALRRLPDRFAPAGLSQGGLIALEIVRQAPERVPGLALLDTRIFLTRPDYRPLLPQIAVPALVLVGDRRATSSTTRTPP